MVYVASERPVRIIIAIIIITNGYLIYDPYINIVPRHVCIIMPLSSFNSPCHGRITGLLPRPAVSETAQLPVMGQFTIMIYLMGMRNHYSFCCNYNFFVIDQNMLFISWIGCPKNEGTSLFSSTDQWEWRSMNTTLKNPGTLFNSKFVKMPEFKQSKPCVSRRKSQQKPTANHKVTSSSCSVSNDISRHYQSKQTKPRCTRLETNWNKALFT